MKKLILLLGGLFISLSASSALPAKYVKIATDGDNNVYYGNTEDDYQTGSGWIAANYKNGRSSLQKVIANCQSKTISTQYLIVYAKRDLKGRVVTSSENRWANANSVVPDTIGEAQFNFLCYGAY